MNCSNSIANALELLQSCTKPLVWCISTEELLWHSDCLPDPGSPDLSGFLFPLSVQTASIGPVLNFVDSLLNNCSNSSKEIATGKLDLQSWVAQKATERWQKFLTSIFTFGLIRREDNTNPVVRLPIGQPNFTWFCFSYGVKLLIDIVSWFKLFFLKFFVLINSWWPRGPKWRHRSSQHWLR